MESLLRILLWEFRLYLIIRFNYYYSQPLKGILFSEIVIQAYSEGYFPMAESSDGEIYWHSPDPRAIIPLGDVKIPRSMRQILKKRNFDFTFNHDFELVIRKCADREETWINDEIIQTYVDLNRSGYAQSVETWQDGRIVGGLYGVSIGGAFFGESMFNSVSDASKAAYYALIKRLIERNFVLLDSQYINPHTEMFGAIEISRDYYIGLLRKAIKLPCKFDK